MSLANIARFVTKCDLIPLAAPLQKPVFCTQTDTQTHGRTHRCTDRQADSNIPRKLSFCRGIKNINKMCL